uniref:F-box domain-containing protein n=1 Tax=Strigamia maritima TaxID=126957 RepID=T1JH75_STRMM
MMSHQEESVESVMPYLPPEILSLIFSFCDIKTIGKLAQVCRRFYEIITRDCMWIPLSKSLLVANQETDGIKNRSCRLLIPWQKLRLSYNWKKAFYNEVYLIKHQTRYMPWLQMSCEKLWYSKGSVIQCFQRCKSGYIVKQKPIYTLMGHVEDVCRFVHRRCMIISGGRDGCICGWNAETGEFLFYKRSSHTNDVNSVDAAENIILSGSKDQTVQVWSSQNQTLVQQYSLNIEDRVWAVALSPHLKTFLVGTAGYYNLTPLQLFDLETGALLNILGNDYPKGAGVLDIVFETPHTVLTGGYDTYIRIVLRWEDPHDSVVYCLATDDKYTILSGTALHGLVRLWDKRLTKSVQMYYVGHRNSPVYSVTFDPCYMYVALDSSVNFLNFGNPYFPNNFSSF